jgi:hypothetical protein
VDVGARIKIGSIGLTAIGGGGGGSPVMRIGSIGQTAVPEGASLEGSRSRDGEKRRERDADFMTGLLETSVSDEYTFAWQNLVIGFPI